MALGSTQPLVKISTRNIPVGKGGRCVGLTTSPPARAKCHEIWEPKPTGTLWATPGLLRDCFTLLLRTRGLCFKKSSSVNRGLVLKRKILSCDGDRFFLCFFFKIEARNASYLGPVAPSA
jgi:hypothetical protein